MSGPGPSAGRAERSAPQAAGRAAGGERLHRQPASPASPWRRRLGRAIAVALRILGATWRIRLIGEDAFARDQVRLGALWHRDALMAAHYFRDRRVMLPVSLSRDGELFDIALQSLGYAPSARGSSSRGASGLLRQLIRGVRRGLPVAVLPDGPRGPARRAKPGVVALASACGVPIVPIAFAGRPAFASRNWDRTSIPLPFARVVVRFGPPLEVPRRLDDDERRRVVEELERRLDALRVEVDRAAGGEPDASPRSRPPAILGAGVPEGGQPAEAEAEARRAPRSDTGRHEDVHAGSAANAGDGEGALGWESRSAS